MKISSDTNYHVLEMGCYQVLSKSQICKMQFRTYLAWVNSLGLGHASSSYYLARARVLYNMHLEYAKLESEPTVIMEIAA